jgi:chromosome segregation ATPase
MNEIVTAIVRIEERLAVVDRRIEERLEAVDRKIEQLVSMRRKSLEWIANMSEQVQSLDAFREEVRQSLEPLFGKLENLDEVLRILRHATSDVSRRVERIEAHRLVV